MTARTMTIKFNWVIACLLVSSLVAQDDSVLPKPEEGAAKPTTEGLTKEQDAQQQIRRRLFEELDLLIPGEFVEGSPQKKGVEKAVAAFQQGDSPEATRHLEKLKKEDPSFPPVELLQAGLVFAAGNPTQGFQILEGAALKYPDYPGIYFAFARLAISQKRLTDAAALLDKAARTTKANPLSDDETLHFQIQFYDANVDVGMRQKRYDTVREYLEKLEAVAPESNKIPITHAELDFIDENYESSFARLKGLNEKSPNSNLPEIVIAQWFQSTGKTEEAGTWISKAANAYPDNPAVQFQFANYAIGTNQFAEANSAIKKIESKVGETPESVLLRAKMAFADEAYGMAEGHYKKLTELQPESFDAANMYALSLIENTDEAKQKLAVEIAQRNYQSLPGNQIAQAAFGWILWRRGNKNDAQSLLTRAARSPQLAPEIAFFLATMMHDNGSSQQAKLVLEPALKTPGLFLYRSAARKLMNQIDAAIESSLPNPNE